MANRGRPTLSVKLPKSAQFTMNDLVNANPHITCRLTLYTKRNELLEAKRIVKLALKRKTGGVGKSLDVYENVAVVQAAKKAKATVKAKMAKAKAKTAPVVDMTAAPAPVAEPETVAS